MKMSGTPWPEAGDKTDNASTALLFSMEPRIETINLKGQFLVAMPHMSDPNFHRAVVLVCDHSPEGAMGLVVNRSLPCCLREVLVGLEIQGAGGGEALAHYGGPVEPQIGFLLYSGGPLYEHSLRVTESLWLGTTLNILEQISRNEGPDKFFFALGYSGWGPGQLDEEIRRNDWLVIPASEQIVYDLPYEDRWDATIRMLGITPDMLGKTVGTA
jgi:putative transcriptional regulator